MSNSLPLVSIITPSYNQGRFLESTVRSVLEQDYPNIEYIIVDGGSTDNSVDIIEKFADKLSWWVSEPDKGQTDAINKGFSHANGDILAWLNSDDTYEQGAVREAVEYLTTHADVGLVYGECNFIDEEGHAFGIFPAAQTDYGRLRRGYVHVPQQSSFWRANLWKQVGPLDDSFYFAMDYDLWVRLAKITQVKYLPGRMWANFRLHSDAKSIAADDRCWPEMLRVHYRDGGSFFSVITVKYAIRKIVAPIWNWRRRRQMTQAS